jgi:hypothetical protein
MCGTSEQFFTFRQQEIQHIKDKNILSVFVQGSLVNDFPFCELLQIKVITFTF